MSNTDYFRPLVQVGPMRAQDAVTLAGGWGWFERVEVLSRGRAPVVIPAQDMPDAARRRLSTPRAAIRGMAMDQPQIMGILNATPDSFSDGGTHAAARDAVVAGSHMVAAGATILDVGGESTRPGAQTVPVAEEIARVVPVIKGLRSAGLRVPISVDTRKAEVAAEALEAGANLVNDVSGFTFDPALARLCARAAQPVCVMHALGDPTTMQDNPEYDDVLLDVYDFLHAQIDTLMAQGIPEGNILADPGIGFGKTIAHNLALLARLSLFHGLGVPVLLGASRKGFIGKIGQEANAMKRAPGSMAVALAALSHGVQMLRVHDVAETVQAVALWRAAMTGKTI